MEITITMKIEDEKLKDLLGLQKEKPRVKVKRIKKPYIHNAVFDERCAGWSKDPETNRFFLELQQNYATEKLKQQGYLFLNDVYDMLGLPRTKVGQVKGWVYDEEYPIGDNYVDFGLNEKGRHFIGCRKNSVLLTFNVDGDVFYLMRD